MSTTVRVKKRGPLLLEGDFTVLDVDGREVPSNGGRLALCRCGASRCRPLCDGSHNRVGFGADDEPKPGAP